MKMIKAYCWLFVAWWVKTLGVRNQAWFEEHVGRVRELKRQRGMGEFGYAEYAKKLLAENKRQDRSGFVEYVEHGSGRRWRNEVEVDSGIVGFDKKVEKLGRGGEGQKVEKVGGGGQRNFSSFEEEKNINHHCPPPPHLSTCENPRILAFYLPQFHSFKENDEWHGRGFTEWTNVTRALPQFIGHHQPQLPIDVGFYDLANPKVMYRQVELAKNYGIYGFCFHYYWFTGGKRLLEKPLFNWLEHQDLDLPFMLCWANENWSKLWDGGNREVLMRQESRVDDAPDFFRDVLPFLQDPRYIRIDGKPHLIIYRPNLFTKEDCLAFCAKLRDLAEAAGLGGLFLSMVGHENFPGTAAEWGFDAMVEFPPMRLMQKREYAGVQTNPDCKTLVYDMGKMLADERLIEIPDEGVPVFRGIFPGWDNTSRKAYSNASCYPLSPSQYGDWLRRLIAWETRHNESDKRYIFVNAWNEWAEGAHLEPDSVRGYDYLEETWKTLEKKVER